MVQPVPVTAFALAVSVLVIGAGEPMVGPPRVVLVTRVYPTRGRRRSAPSSQT